ncbi:MAG: phosphotransferase [Micromonosporaceae bacterium]
MRFTMNAVYRLPSAGVVVRMRTGPHATAQVTRVAQVAAALAKLDLPVVRLAPGVPQPVHADGWSATVWTLLEQTPGHRFAPADLAGPLRRLHSLEDAPTTLPRWDVLGAIRRRLAETTGKTGADLAFLERWAIQTVGTPLDSVLRHLVGRCDQLAADLTTVEWTLPEAAIHGDAHAANLLRGADGEVVICDLDSTALGPPEWDLTPAAHGAVRFGDDPRKYAQFAAAYGLDVTTCPAWDTLREIRELQLVTSVIANLPGRPEVAEQLAHRLRSSLAGDRRALWQRYR